MEYVRRFSHGSPAEYGRNPLERPPLAPSFDAPPRPEKAPGMLAAFGRRIADAAMRTFGLQQMEPAFAGGPVLGRLEGAWDQATTLRVEYGRARGQAAEGMFAKIGAAWNGAKKAFADLGLKEEIYELFPALEPEEARNVRERARYDRLTSMQLGAVYVDPHRERYRTLNSRAQRAALTLAWQYEKRGGQHPPDRLNELQKLAKIYAVNRHRDNLFDKDTNAYIDRLVHGQFPAYTPHANL